MKKFNKESILAQINHLIGGVVICASSNGNRLAARITDLFVTSDGNDLIIQTDAKVCGREDEPWGPFNSQSINLNIFNDVSKWVFIPYTYDSSGYAHNEEIDRSRGYGTMGKRERFVDIGLIATGKNELVEITYMITLITKNWSEKFLSEKKHSHSYSGNTLSW